MSKDFPSFDCDAHIAEPMEIWERAEEHLTRAEVAALKTTLWYDRESDQLIVNDTVGAGIRSKEGRGTAGALNLISVAGPGMKHAIQRARSMSATCAPKPRSPRRRPPISITAAPTSIA